jgi:hypothetical protein
LRITKRPTQYPQDHRLTPCDLCCQVVSTAFSLPVQFSHSLYNHVYASREPKALRSFIPFSFIISVLATASSFLPLEAASRSQRFYPCRTHSPSIPSIRPRARQKNNL